jgi:hypothetical protein
MRAGRRAGVYRGLGTIALVAALQLLAAGEGYSQTLGKEIQLEFGKLVEPYSGSETWTVDTSDSGSGTATQVSGPNVSGEYRIKKGGGADSPLFIDVNPSGSLPGLTIGSFTATYDGSPISLPASGLPAPGSAGKILRLGATLTITTSVTTGTNLPGFTITVIKE